MILKKLIIIFLTAFVTWGCGNSDEPRNWNEPTGNETAPDIEWVKIEKGSFTFGSPPGTPCRSAYSEEEVEVELTNSFVMASTEITKAQWKALDLPHVPWWQGENKPVTRINFYEAALWSNKLSMLEGLETCYNLDNCKNPVGTGCIIDENRTGEACSNPNTQPIFVCDGNIHKYQDRYSCPGYRLPTVAEWEYAAKANVTDTHTYGGDLHGEGLGFCSDQPSLNDIAWYCHNSNNQANEVAQKLPNPWGLYDMLGNVAELVDYYFRGATPLINDHPDSGDVLINPTGPASGGKIEVRGSFFDYSGCVVRPSDRLYTDTTSRSIRRGFRPVRTIFVEGAEDDVEPDPEEDPEEDSEEEPEEDSEEVPNPGL